MVVKHLAREDLNVAVNHRPLYVSCALHTGFHYWCKPIIRTLRIEARYVLVEIGKLHLFKLPNSEKINEKLEMAFCALPSPGCMVRMIIFKNAHLAQWLDAYSVFLSMKFRYRVRNLRCLLPREFFSEYLLGEFQRSAERAQKSACIRNDT